jgi:hypothetical protein
MIWWLVFGLAVIAIAGSDNKDAPDPTKNAKFKPGQDPTIDPSLPTTGEMAGYLYGRGELPLVPIYAGFPGTLKIPNGYSAIKVWVTKDGKTYPDPLRFAEFHGIAAREEPERGELVEKFARVYWFGVVENGSLTFYVIGKPTPHGCCALINCKRTSDPTTQIWTNKGGTPDEWAKKMGPLWKCNCEGTTDQCFTLYPADPADWPRANVPPAKGIKDLIAP